MHNAKVRILLTTPPGCNPLFRNKLIFGVGKVADRIRKRLNKKISFAFEAKFERIFNFRKMIIFEVIYRTDFTTTVSIISM